ncbi:MAG TPA: hypothetical protein VM008_16295 [Phycisphaerae bacterium]|nr:hypothetical protein [Phycisphaerae bacterium]
MTVAELEARLTAAQREIVRLEAELEHAQAVAGIKRGLDEANRGLGKPLREVDEELRTKYNIPRQ